MKYKSIEQIVNYFCVFDGGFNKIEFRKKLFSAIKSYESQQIKEQKAERKSSISIIIKRQKTIIDLNQQIKELEELLKIYSDKDYKQPISASEWRKMHERKNKH